MTMEWSFAGGVRNAGKEEGGASEYEELYERAREATREAQRQGDAQLKAAMAAAAAATAVEHNPIRLSPLSLRFNNTRLERAYWRKSSTNPDSRDVLPFAFHFLVRITLISLLLQARQAHTAAANKEDIAFLLLPSFLTRLLSYIWAAIICATVLVIHLWFSSWYRGNRGTILLIAAASLWVGEGIALLASHPNSIHDLVLISMQCIFMSVLHRVPFCLHLKTRAFGFGLQIFGTLTRVRVDEAIAALLFVSLGHFLGIMLAYVLDQQSRVGFLRSLPRSILDEMSGGTSSTQFLSYRATLSQQLWNSSHPELFELPKGDMNFLFTDCQLSSQQTPRRALGGFAGGFGGVSSLKGTYSPSFLTVSPTYNILGEEYISDCDSTTVENSMDGFSCKHRCVPLVPVK